MIVVLKDEIWLFFSGKLLKICWYVYVCVEFIVIIVRLLLMGSLGWEEVGFGRNGKVWKSEVLCEGGVGRIMVV